MVAVKGYRVGRFPSFSDQGNTKSKCTGEERPNCIEEVLYTEEKAEVSLPLEGQNLFIFLSS